LICYQQVWKELKLLGGKCMYLFDSTGKFI
jgi:hypothetical protein